MGRVAVCHGWRIISATGARSTASTLRTCRGKYSRLCCFMQRREPLSELLGVERTQVVRAVVAPGFGCQIEVTMRDRFFDLHLC